MGSAPACAAQALLHSGVIYEPSRKGHHREPRIKLDHIYIYDKIAPNAVTTMHLSSRITITNLIGHIYFMFEFLYEL